MWQGSGRVVGVACALALTACLGSSTTEFPPGLEPLEPNTAPTPQGGPAAEELALVEGTAYHPGLDRDYIFVHGRGQLRASPGQVWRALKDGERLSSSCRISAWTVTENIDDTYEYSFEVANSVDDVVTVSWEEEWRFGTVEGTPEAPELAMVRYQKTYGSDFIYLIEGSIQALATDDPEVTTVEFIEHLAALGGAASDIRSTMERRFALLAAAVHDDPTPACP